LQFKSEKYKEGVGSLSAFVPGCSSEAGQSRRKLKKNEITSQNKDHVSKKAIKGN